MSFNSAAILTSWIAILVLSFAMAGLYARITEIQAVGGLGGSGFAPPRSDGKPSADSTFLFVSNRCEVCRTLVPVAVTMHEEGQLPARQLVIVSRESQELAGFSLEADRYEAIADPKLMEQFGVTATPTVAYVDADSRVAKISPVASIERFRHVILESPESGRGRSFG